VADVYRALADPTRRAILDELTERYSKWALQTFGRIERDPARIEPFLRYLGRAWLGHAESRFGELACSSFPLEVNPDDPRRWFSRGLQLIEDDLFLKLLDHPGAVSGREISERYVHRGPLGDLLDRLEPPDPQSPP
jgi:hypothetical protein